MIGMNIKPVFILSRGAGVFVDQKGGLQMVVDGDANRNRIDALLTELRAEVGDHVTILDELMVGDPSDFKSLFTSKDEIHVIIAYFLGVTPIEELLRWKGPIIAFSGQHTPAFSLYAVGEERHVRSDLYIALDYHEIRRLLRVLEVKRSLAHTRVVLMGLPAPWHLRWYGFPDLEAIRRKVGVEFVPVELRELLEIVKKVDMDKAASLAREWMDEARQVMEPSPEHLQQSAAAYLAMDQILSRKGAKAMAINCLEITQSRKFSEQIINPCMAMTRLRDDGIPSACEMDVAALLTMILLGNLSNSPSFLGNIVRAEPDRNVIKLSHCILPTRMPGFGEAPLPYTLRDFHGNKGVTAFTHVPPGEKLTLARAHRNLERVVALAGEVLECEDTTFCRNTLTIQINDVREFIRKAEGNHHIAIFGDYMDELKALCEVLDCQFISI
jgi:L-fucose isomerase-like protein